MGVEEEALAEVLEIEHGIFVDGGVDELLHLLAVARHEDVLHEVDYCEDLVLVDYDEAERGLDYLQLLFYYLG